MRSLPGRPSKDAVGQALRVCEGNGDGPTGGDAWDKRNLLRWQYNCSVISRAKLNARHEKLTKDMFFSKLAMSRAGFGSMATMGQVDGPWQYQWLHCKFVTGPPRADQFV